MSSFPGRFSLAPRSPIALCCVLAGIAAACASAPKPAPRPPPARAPSALPRSSVAALLAHRTELALDDQQVKSLEEVQAELDGKQAEVRQGLTAAAGGQAKALEGESPAGEGHQRGRGMMGSPGRPRSRTGSKQGRQPAESDVERALDDEDTEAFFRAEKLLQPAQRERARGIAESYREALYDEREQAKRPPPAARP